VLGGSDVTQLARVCTSFLGGSLDAPWTVGVPEMDMSVAEVVAHIADGCLWYAIDLSAAGKDLEPVEHRVKPDGAAADLLDTVTTYAAVVAAVIDAAPPDVRGFHPMGMADPSGFAAMACDELLIHTDDAGRGLGRAFTPPEEVVEAVLRRLFPWAPAAGDPWELLRWANGRVALPGLPRLDGWAWHCAPLDEWDGTRATRPVPAGDPEPEPGA
jgi:hypothetical protein